MILCKVYNYCFMRCIFCEIQPWWLQTIKLSYLILSILSFSPSASFGKLYHGCPEIFHRLLDQFFEITQAHGQPQTSSSLNLYWEIAKANPQVHVVIFLWFPTFAHRKDIKITSRISTKCQLNFPGTYKWEEIQFSARLEFAVLRRFNLESSFAL